MDTTEASKKILKVLEKWAEEKHKLVIGLDGITGVGKTTIAEYVANNNPKVELIHIDDFMTPLKFRENEINKLDDPTDFFIHNWFEYEDLRNIITKFRSGKIQKYQTLAYRNGKRDVPIEYDLNKSVLIIEGVLLFHAELIDDVWDKRIFLDGNEEEITKRRVIREKKRWGNKYIPESNSISWSRFILPGLKKYQELYKPKEKADLVLEIDTN